MLMRTLTLLADEERANDQLSAQTEILRRQQVTHACPWAQTAPAWNHGRLNLLYLLLTQ